MLGPGVLNRVVCEADPRRPFPASSERHLAMTAPRRLCVRISIQADRIDAPKGLEPPSPGAATNRMPHS